MHRDDYLFRTESRAAATSKMEPFVITVNGFQPLTIITKCSMLDVAAALDPPLLLKYKRSKSADENPENMKKCEIQKSFDTIISKINLT